MCYVYDSLTFYLVIVFVFYSHFFDFFFFFFFSSRRRHTRSLRDWSSDVCSSDLEKSQSLCLSCADLDRLVFLPAGDTALSRRARKHSPLSAVVVRFSRARGRYERKIGRASCRERGWSWGVGG